MHRDVNSKTGTVTYVATDAAVFGILMLDFPTGLSE